MTDMIYEWWQARNSLMAAEERLSIAMGWDMVADLAVRDESAETPAEPRAPRSALLSRRSFVHSQQIEHDMSEPD